MSAKGERKVLELLRGNRAVNMIEEEEPFSLYLTDSDSDGEERMLEQIRPKIPSGFISPDTPLQLEDCLKVHAVDTNQIQICVAPTIYNPSELYLTLADHYPAKVNALSEKMTDTYTKLSKQPRRFQYMADKRLLGSNSTVAVYRRDVKEWARAVIRKVLQTEPEYSYRVQLIDFGEYWDVSQHDILYLHESFFFEDQEVIKCRLHLSSNYQDYHSGKRWPEEVKSDLYNALCDKKFETKFVRLIESNNDRVWEVSLESICDSSDGKWKAGIPIQQIIEDTLRCYEHDRTDDPTFNSQLDWIDDVGVRHYGDQAQRCCRRTFDFESDGEVGE